MRPKLTPAFATLYATVILLAASVSSAIAPTTRTQNIDLAPECGRRPICVEFPWICREFASNLLRGFSPAEVPFVARVTVSEHLLSNNSVQCVAVALSQRDLILNGKCFRINDKKDNDFTVEWNLSNKSASQWLDPATTARINNGAFTLLSSLPNGDDITAESTSEACIETTPVFAFSGVVCGFPTKDVLELSCRVLELSNAELNDLPQVDSKKIEGLRDGAAVFRRAAAGESNENWRLIGFTNPEGQISTLSIDDCLEFGIRTNGRVQCQSDAPIDADILPTSLLDTMINGINTSASVPNDDQGSVLLPGLIFGSILILGVILCILMAKKSSNNAAYDTI